VPTRDAGGPWLISSSHDWIAGFQPFSPDGQVNLTSRCEWCRVGHAVATVLIGRVIVVLDSGWGVSATRCTIGHSGRPAGVAAVTWAMVVVVVTDWVMRLATTNRGRHLVGSLHPALGGDDHSGLVLSGTSGGAGPLSITRVP